MARGGVSRRRAWRVAVPGGAPGAWRWRCGRAAGCYPWARRRAWAGGLRRMGWLFEPPCQGSLRAPAFHLLARARFCSCRNLHFSPLPFLPRGSARARARQRLLHGAALPQHHSVTASATLIDVGLLGAASGDATHARGPMSGAAHSHCVSAGSADELPPAHQRGKASVVRCWRQDGSPLPSARPRAARKPNRRMHICASAGGNKTQGARPP